MRRNQDLRDQLYFPVVNTSEGRAARSLGFFMSGEKRYLMEWVVVGQTRPGKLLRLIIWGNLPGPGGQKFVFSC